MSLSLVLISSVEADWLGFVHLARRLKGKTGIIPTLHLSSKLADFEFNSAQRPIFGEVLIIHHFEKESLFVRMYWCIDDLVPDRIKVYQEVSKQLRRAT